MTVLLSLMLWTLAQQPAPKKTPAVSRYDTAAQTKQKRYELARWCMENSSKESPCSSRKEYALNVLEIIKRVPVHRYTLEMFEHFDVDDENGNYLANGWLTFLGLPDEVGRSKVGDSEIVMWAWKNSDGSGAIGTYRDGHLVSKAQSGLR